MSLGTIWRLTRDRLEPTACRASIRSGQKKFDSFNRLSAAGAGDFRAHVQRNWKTFLLGSLVPVRGATRERAHDAYTWLCRAQDASPDNGVSYGFFPARFEAGWGPSYPETTGYIIQTFIEYGRRYDVPDALERATLMALWEIDVQMANGAVQGGILCSPAEQTPAVFNTGMVLQGYTALWRLTHRSVFLDAGRRAADFLMSDLGPDHSFRTNGRFVAANQKKTYNCLCAWAMYRLGEDSGDRSYQRAAERIVEAAISEQQPNGWIANNCLSKPLSPLTHTIGYALQGILEVGALTDRTDFLAAVQRALDPLIARMHPDGFLAGRFYSNWQPAALSSCLTGSAQIAIVCYRAFQILGDHRYIAAGDNLLDFLKAVQVTDSPVGEVRGALAGSFPIVGDYMYLGYPNWATKYLLDALMLQDEVHAASPFESSEVPRDHMEPGSGTR